jgi:glutamate-ammonia-ligase adenylyltransferase
MTPERSARAEAIREALDRGDTAALASALAGAGFRAPDESAGILRSLGESPAFRARAADCLAEVLRAADPDAALLGLDRFADAHADRIGRPLTRSMSLSSSSPFSRFLTNFLTQDPGALARLAASPWLDAEKPREALDRDLSEAAGPAPDFESLQRALRRVRALEMLRIATRDLTGRAGVEVVMRELSRLADEPRPRGPRLRGGAAQRYGWAAGIGGGREEARSP